MDGVTVDAWLADLAAKQPTPGGGGAAALHAAIAAALLGMVTAYTTGKKWADREASMLKLNKEVEGLRKKALGLIAADAAAFAKVGAAYALPIEKEAAREAAIQKSLVGAAKPPFQVVKLATRLIEIAQEITETSNPNVISDVAVAATTAAAAIESAIVNIEINEVNMTDNSVRAQLQQSVREGQQAINRANNVIDRVRLLIKGAE
jgi:methenyltetrahydrofolate cyclohydrolase